MLEELGEMLNNLGESSAGLSRHKSGQNQGHVQLACRAGTDICRQHPKRSCAGLRLPWPDYQLGRYTLRGRLIRGFGWLGSIWQASSSLYVGNSTMLEGESLRHIASYR